MLCESTLRGYGSFVSAGGSAVTALLPLQVIFCRREDFRAVGGYDRTLPIMEDIDLVMRMHYRGVPAAPAVAAVADEGRRAVTAVEGQGGGGAVRRAGDGSSARIGGASGTQGKDGGRVQRVRGANGPPVSLPHPIPDGTASGPQRIQCVSLAQRSAVRCLPSSRATNICASPCLTALSLPPCLLSRPRDPLPLPFSPLPNPSPSTFRRACPHREPLRRDGRAPLRRVGQRQGHRGALRNRAGVVLWSDRGAARSAVQAALRGHPIRRRSG